MKVSNFFGSITLTSTLVLISSISFAQSTEDSDDATVAAEVLATISVTNDRNVDFAIIEQDITDNNPVIDPDDAGGDAFIIGDPTVGVFHIEGTVGQDIIFGAGNFSAIQLVNGDDADFAFDFTPSLYGVAGELSSDARGADGSDISSGNTGTLTDGEFTVYVGGVLDNPVDNATGTNDNETEALLAGDYTGTYTLTIDYD